MSQCTFPDCNNEAEFKCAVCGKAFCADHTYERYYHTHRYYFCKAHFQREDKPLPHEISDSAFERLLEAIRRLIWR